MSVPIKQNLVDPSRYGLKSPYAMTPEFIVTHNTANDASAANEIAYMRRNDNNTSFHYAVDDVEVVQGLPLNRNGWHAGDGANGRGNRKGIGIEICYSKSGGPRFDKAEQNAAWLTAKLLHARGWGVDRVKKHQDFMNKYCPHRTLDYGWQRYLNMVQSELNLLNKPVPKPEPEPVSNVVAITALPAPINVRLVRDTSLWNFDFAKYTDAKAVKDYKAGDLIENVVAIGQNKLGSEYYITGYSYGAKLTHGFNVKDCEVVTVEPVVPPVEPEPEPEPQPEPEPIPEPEPQPEPEQPTEPNYNQAFRQLLSSLISWFRNIIKILKGNKK